MLSFQFFGVNLHHHRRRRRFTEADLGRRANPPISQAVISRLENGLRPSAHHVDALARALDMSPSALFARPRVVQRSRVRPVVIEDTRTRGTDGTVDAQVR